jgi:hypothetical protein
MIQKLLVIKLVLVTASILVSFIVIRSYVQLVLAQTTMEDTFSGKGLVSSTTSNANELPDIIKAKSNKATALSPYRLAGTWHMNVNSGNVTNFEMTFTMKAVSGSNRTHTHEITNFQSERNRYIQLTPDGSTFILGTVTVRTNNTDKWKNVGATMIIENLNKIKIILDSNATNNHFNGPIYGSITSLKDHAGREMINNLPIANMNTTRTIPSPGFLSLPPTGLYPPNAPLPPLTSLPQGSVIPGTNVPPDAMHPQGAPLRPGSLRIHPPTAPLPPPIANIPPNAMHPPTAVFPPGTNLPPTAIHPPTVH